MSKKIAKFVKRKQDNFLTLLEKNWRDWFFKPLTTFLFYTNITANHITIFGLILVSGAIAGFIYDINIKWQFLIILIAALSDAIDGPRARNHNEVTALGTWLDHVRDGFLIFWMTFLIYHFRLLTLEWIIIIWTIEIFISWILIKDFLIKLLQKPYEEWREVAREYSFEKLQATVIGRAQFLFINLGYLVLLSSLLKTYPTSILVGKAFLVLAIIFSTMNTYEIYTKR